MKNTRGRRELQEKYIENPESIREKWLFSETRSSGY